MSQEEENRPEKLRGHIQKLKAELASMKDSTISTEKAYRALINARKDSRNEAYAAGWQAGAEAQREAVSEEIYATVVMEKGLSASQLRRCAIQTPLVTLPKGDR